MAYKLKLPKDSRIHPVFHVSLLRKKLGATQNASVELSPITIDEEIIFKPEAILDTRVKKGVSLYRRKLG